MKLILIISAILLTSSVLGQISNRLFSSDTLKSNSIKRGSIKIRKVSEPIDVPINKNPPPFVIGHLTNQKNTNFPCPRTTRNSEELKIKDSTTNIIDKNIFTPLNIGFIDEGSWYFTGNDVYIFTANLKSRLVKKAKKKEPKFIKKISRLKRKGKIDYTKYNFSYCDDCIKTDHFKIYKKITFIVKEKCDNTTEAKVDSSKNIVEKTNTTPLFDRIIINKDTLSIASTAIILREDQTIEKADGFSIKNSLTRFMYGKGITGKFKSSKKIEGQYIYLKLHEKDFFNRSGELVLNNYNNKNEQTEIISYKTENDSINIKSSLSFLSEGKIGRKRKKITFRLDGKKITFKKIR
jgi:hypothetical protein